MPNKPLISVPYLLLTRDQRRLCTDLFLSERLGPNAQLLWHCQTVE
ncbi:MULTISPECIES: hypothetical protein [unclassified Pseudomonas]|nr:MULTISPECIES: hypothetical protein [unclassified Pseudomonas]NMY39290.1 hypothetical protein [Pseudomonas sp. WS 5078]NMY62117.1 hypothetical protein [Pseudomonas sp. WS 5354]